MQVVVGGHDGNTRLSSIELFPRPVSDTCFIPELPRKRPGHSLSLLSGGRLVVCGGLGFDSCISWVTGNTSWTHLYTMRCLSIIQLACEARRLAQKAERP